MVNILTTNEADSRNVGSIPWSGNNLEKVMATCSSIFAWESHAQRSLAGYNYWCYKELDMTEQSQISIYLYLYMYIYIYIYIIFHTILIEILHGREYYLSFEDEDKCTTFT